MESKTSTYYKLSIQGHNGYLAQDGYSKYYERLTKINEGMLPANAELYGLDQAREHAKEYYDKKNEYTKQRRRDILKIIKVTTIEEEVETLSAK